jgi:hypothetical protein
LHLFLSLSKPLKLYDIGILMQLLVPAHYTSSCFYLKHTFRTLDSFSVFRWKLLSWAQPIELVLITRQQHQSSTVISLFFISITYIIKFFIYLCSKSLFIFYG